MPQSTDLVGLGMAPELARELGNQASTLTCLAASTQTGAAKILTTNVELSAASGSLNSAILPTLAKVGTPYLFFGGSSTAALVYPPVGDNMNGSANAACTVAQNKGVIIMKYKQSGSTGSWSSITTA